jgi:hypothetical protein
MTDGEVRLFYLYKDGNRRAVQSFCHEFWSAGQTYGGQLSTYLKYVERGSFFPKEWEKPFFKVFVHDGCIDQETIDVIGSESGYDDMVVIDLSKEAE